MVVCEETELKDGWISLLLAVLMDYLLSFTAINKLRNDTPKRLFRQFSWIIQVVMVGCQCVTDNHTMVFNLEDLFLAANQWVFPLCIFINFQQVIRYKGLLLEDSNKKLSRRP
jgi:hypothetical protein